MSGTSVGKLLGLGQPAVSRAVVRGEKLIQYMNLSLIKREMHFCSLLISSWAKEA